MNAQILKDLRYNYAYNLLDGGFFGLALGFASFVTVIPLFVSTLTGSAILIGLVPAIHNMGWQLPQLLVANRVSRQTRYKPMVLAMTIHERIPFILLALVAWIIPIIGEKTALILVFVLLIWQGLGGGFAASPWQSMIAKIFPPDRRGTFYGSQSAVANALASLSAIAAGYILGGIDSPLDFTYCFIFASASMVLSWYALSRVREPDNVRPLPEQDTHQFWESIRQILEVDRNFRWFLGVRMLSQVAMMGYAFYTVYAVTKLGVNEVTIGIMTGVMMGTSIVVNPLMGWIGDHWSRRLIMAAGIICASASAVIAWLAPSPGWFYPVFILAAIANVAIWAIGLAMIPDFGAENERPSYIGLANTLTAPFSILAPLFGGWLAETGGYHTTFIVSAVGGLVAAAALIFLMKDPGQTLRAV